jgi:hypothetical protein
VDNTKNLLPRNDFGDNLNDGDENVPHSDDFNGSINDSDEDIYINSTKYFYISASNDDVNKDFHISKDFSGNINV